MKFSELLGEPEPDGDLDERDLPERDLPERDLPERDLPEAAEPVNAFAPVPVSSPPAATVAYPSSPPEPVIPRPEATRVAGASSFASTFSPPEVPVPAPVPPGPRTGLAEVNVRQDEAAPIDDGPAVDSLAMLDTVVDDLLPSTVRRGRK